MMSKKQHQEVMHYIDTFYPKHSDTPETKKKLDQKRIELGERNKTQYFNGLFQGLKEVAKGYHVRDFTDEEFPGLTFIVLLHKDQDILDSDRELLKALGGTQYNLEIYISMISPYFCMHIEKTTLKETNSAEIWDFTAINNYENCDICKRIRDYLVCKNFEEIKLKDALILADNRDVPYTEEGKTTIYDCLFDDLATVYLLNGSRKVTHLPDKTYDSWNWDENIDWDSLRYNPDKAAD